MSKDEIESAALKLEPKARARLAARLLESLESLSAEENERLWLDEAQRRADAMESGTLASRPAEAAFREARSRI